MKIINENDFEPVFRFNLSQRRRTTNGISAQTSDLKLPPLLCGPELEKQLEKNTEQFISCVHRSFEFGMHDRVGFHVMFDNWFDTLHEGILDTEGYRLKRREVIGDCPFGNNRYRIWNVDYDPTNPSPKAIGQRMVYFISFLDGLTPDFGGHSLEDASVSLAQIDRHFDEVIHPWIDGCGRMATALIMWFSLKLEVYPQFTNSAEHYEAIKSPQTHREYFRKCFGLCP